jgi:predicted nuclease of restriction endonuclease-like (RecB) superfamily
MGVLTKASVTEEAGFAEIVGLIAAARRRAFQAVNTTLIDLYWQVGEYISRKIEAAEWGDSVVPQLAQYIAQTQPGQRGSTRPNLFRMKQLYEVYRDSAIVSPLVRQLPWTHNLIILGQSKRPEEREFYLRMAVRERWTKRHGCTLAEKCEVMRVQGDPLHCGIDFVKGQRFLWPQIAGQRASAQSHHCPPGLAKFARASVERLGLHGAKDAPRRTRARIVRQRLAASGGEKTLRPMKRSGMDEVPKPSVGTVGYARDAKEVALCVQNRSIGSPPN